MPYIEFMAANAAALREYTAAQKSENLPMEGDMLRKLSDFDADQTFGKLFSFGISMYAIALLAQVMQSYSLV